MVAQAVAWVVVLYLHGGLIALGVVTVVISLAGQVPRLIIVHRLIPWFRLSLRRLDRALLRMFSVASGWFSLIEISEAVVNLTDVLIVGAAAGVRAAAIYTVAQRLGLLPLKIVPAAQLPPLHEGRRVWDAGRDRRSCGRAPTARWISSSI